MRRAQYGTLTTLMLVAVGCSGSPTNPPPPPPPPPPGAVVTAIVVTAPSATMSPGTTQTMTAVATNAAGQTVAATLTWQSSLPSVATIDATGLVTAVAAGVTNISASSGGVISNAVSMTVAASNGPVGSVVIGKAAVLLSGSGQSAQLTARIFDPAGVASGGTVTWTSSAPGKVSVDATGRLLAHAIGSAQIVAQAGGVRSAPTIVSVAEPQAGALLLTDGQVVSVGPPLRLGPGEVPQIGTEFEVTVQGVTAPPVGTVVLATETAPVAGKMVASRQSGAGLVLTIAIAPLYQLFRDYNISIALDLSAFPLEGLSAPSAPSAVWNASRRDRGQGIAAAPATVAAPFAFECEASIKPQLLGTPISLSLDNRLSLILDDRPGHSKHALEGSAELVGSAGLKLIAGFKGSGKCEAYARVNLPILGWLSVFVMPAVRLGLGAELDGKVVLVQGELGVEGRVGFAVNLGWECGGAIAGCRGLDDITPKNLLKTKSNFPAEHGMEADISAQFYIFAGLEAAVGGGLLSGRIVDARIGPKQSFNLAFEEDQAARTDYAATYDLKLEGVVEPGAHLKKAIKEVIDDDATGVSFQATFSTNLSESPKGTLTASKARVRPGAAVDFTVDLTPSTVAYWLLDYNVTGVELYRKREDELEFTPWKSMSLIASNRATYQWTPVEADAGKYEFVALVNTKLPTPLLEVAANSTVPVEVSCFSGVAGAPARLGAPPVCSDTWAGDASVKATTPGADVTMTNTAVITWTFDSTDAFGSAQYTGNGTFELAEFRSPECTVTFSPKTFTINHAPTTTIRLVINPTTYGFAGQQTVNTTSTVSCPGTPNVVNELKGFLVQFAFGSGPFTPGQTSLVGTSVEGSVELRWSFARP